MKRKPYRRHAHDDDFRQLYALRQYGLVVFVGNLAGGVLGLPLVGAAGALVDAFILKLENRRASASTTIIVVALAAMMANLICCLKRLLGPTGIAPHDVFGSAGLMLRPLSYAFFGFVAGLVAAITSHVVRRRKTRGSQG